LGRLSWLVELAVSTGARKMTLDPEELVTLKNHGTMKLRSAVARAMILPRQERKGVTIVRKGKRIGSEILLLSGAKRLVPTEKLYGAPGCRLMHNRPADSGFDLAILSIAAAPSGALFYLVLLG
jgi:hypothetical protein